MKILQKSTNAIPVNPKIEQQPILNNVDWLIDSNQVLTINQVGKLAFQPFDFSSPIPFHPYHRFWFRFSLQNNSEQDSLKALICTINRTNIDLYFFQNKHLNHLKGGTHCNIQDRAFYESERCFPIQLAPKEGTQYFLSISDFEKKNPEKLELVLKSYEAEISDRLARKAAKLEAYIFIGFFIGILVFLKIYSGFQFIATKDKAFLFYFGYLIGLFLFYLRGFESWSEWPIPIVFSYLMDWNKHLEIFLEYTCYIFYMLFVQYFLNLKADGPKLFQYINYAIWTFGGLIFLHLLIQLLFGIRVSYTLHSYTKFLFFVPAFVFVFHIFFRQENRLYKYILFGTFLMLLSASFTAIDKTIPGRLYGFWGGTIKAYEMKYLTIYMYHMRVGILLEVICFAFGLSYKNKLRLQNLEQLNEQLTHQKKHIEKITFNTSSQPTNEFLQRLTTIVKNQLDNPRFSTQALADALHLSRSTLYRQLKEQTQQSPSEFIRQYRLQKAKELLLTTNQSIAEIAYQTGFSEPAHLTRAFKKMYDLTPSEMRLQR